MPDWDKSLDAIRTDRSSGSSQLCRTLLGALIEHFDSLADDSFVATDFPTLIRSLRPEMACFHSVARDFATAVDQEGGSLTAAAARSHCRRFLHEFNQAQSAVVRNLWPLVTDCRAIMLHSNSGFLELAVTEVFQRETRIFISEARPDCEGLTLARRLAADGFSVTLFADDARTSFLNEVDVILIGADWIGESDFTNKVGTRALCAFAQALDKPVYVLADRSKFVPSRLRPPRPDSRLSLETRVTVITRIFENTPNHLVGAFVTDGAVLTPARVASQIETARFPA